MVTSLTAAKLKPLKFPVPSYIANTFILTILNDLHLKLAQFYDKKIRNLDNFESQKPMTGDMSVP